MAHLGVLKAFERHGIYIDMLAGTSAGAMTGIIYAAGLDPEYITHFFKADLQPSWFFRHLPAGSYWYLLYKYRLNRFDSMLRKYLGTARMEQLVLPVSTISVDLVEGESVVRGWRCDHRRSTKYQSSSAFASYHPVRPRHGGRRVAQQHSRRRAGS